MVFSIQSAIQGVGSVPVMVMRMNAKKAIKAIKEMDAWLCITVMPVSQVMAGVFA